VSDGQPGAAASHLLRRLGLLDAALLVMGGIVGSGIFLNPSVVARIVGTPALILSAWLFGGAIAVAGAFVYAELSALRPEVGGQYAFLREAFHPAVAFLYGWSLLLVVQSGGMAAVAITFARYAVELVSWKVPEVAVAAAALLVLTLVNAAGVRAGSTVQGTLMVLKIGAIAVLVAAGLWLVPGSRVHWRPLLDRPASSGLLTAFVGALMPVLFAFGGWQTSGFVAGELRHPRRDMPRALLLGVSGVVVLYLAVNSVSLRVLGVDGLASTSTPASEVMHRALGPRGATFIAAAIALSALGFLSQGMLTAPRVYFAMARDGVFFRAVGRVHPRTRVPVLAVVLQGVAALLIAVSGSYEQILGYVVSVDFIAFGLTGTALFVFRARGERGAVPVPGHPWTTGFFVAASWLVVLNTVWRWPENTLVGLGLVLLGFPAWALWRRQTRESR
jgi:basic amino acid/polyamine antiporter, APA family